MDIETYGLIDLSTIFDAGYTDIINFEIDQQKNIIFSLGQQVGNQTKHR